MIVVAPLIVFFGVMTGFILNNIDEHLVELIKTLKDKTTSENIRTETENNKFEDDGK